MTVTLTLPFPPSTNNLFINTSRGRIRSQKYADWSQEAGWELKRQRPSKVAGKVILKFDLGKPDKRRRDASNFIKAPEDLLVEHGIIEADDWSVVQEIRVKWCDEFCGVRVCVEPYGAAENQAEPIREQA